MTWHSFRQRQFFTLLALVAAVLALMLGTILPYSRSFVIDQATAQLETVADLKTAQVQQWLAQGREVADLISNWSHIATRFPVVLDPQDSATLEEARQHLYAELDSVNAVFPNVQSVSLLDPVSGQVLLSTDRAQEGRVRRDEGYFLQSREGLYVSPVEYSVGREAPELTVSAPARGDAGDLLAVVAVEMDLADLGAILANPAGLGRSGRSYVVEAFGFYVTLPPGVEGSPLRTLARSEGVSQALAHQEGSGIYPDPNGVLVLGAYRWLPEVNLALLVEMEEAELIGQVLRTWALILLASLGLLALAAVSAGRLAHWLVTPLERITQAAQRLRAGDLSHRAPPGGPDEIGQLADSFNEMADSLQGTSLELERRVRRRTAELQAAVSELEREITERRRIEAQLRAALDEKELLLQELHHRVKNNLQVVSALLTFQAEDVQDQGIVDAFQDSQNRILSMARVHEQFYRSQDLARIEMESYVQDLMIDLQHAYGAYAVSLEVEAAGVVMDIDTAIPCGLLINELVSNALKHAFAPAGAANAEDRLRGDPNRPVGRIQVVLQPASPPPDNAFALTVSDDGTGLPPGLELRNARSLGLRLVDMLVRQLRGSVEIERSNGGGTAFHITFPGTERRG